MTAPTRASRLLPGLKQFRQEGCITHFVFDPETRDLLIIDPRADMVEDYRTYISEQGLKLKLVIDTRLHWHHLSATHLLAERYSVPIGMSDRTSSLRATRKLAHGETIQLGRLGLQILHTPGVGPDALCVALPGFVFTGDTLLIDTGTRVDLPGGDPEALWNSLYEVIGALPEETVVFPGYDAEDRLFSILKVEKKRNPDWSFKTAAEFLVAKREDRPRGDSDARRRMKLNSELFPEPTSESHFGNASPGVGTPEFGQRLASINVEKYFQKIKSHPEQTYFLDVREPEEFSAGHMPGAANVPLSELALHLDELVAFRRIYVSCQSGRRSLLASKTLDYLGLPDVVNVSGGFQAWVQAGFPVTQD